MIGGRKVTKPNRMGLGTARGMVLGISLTKRHKGGGGGGRVSRGKTKSQTRWGKITFSEGGEQNWVFPKKLKERQVKSRAESRL